MKSRKKVSFTPVGGGDEVVYSPSNPQMPTAISAQSAVFVSEDYYDGSQEQIVVHKRAVIMTTKRRTDVSNTTCNNGVVINRLSATEVNMGNASLGASTPAMAIILDVVDNSMLLTIIYGDGSTAYASLRRGRATVDISAANTAVIAAIVE